MSEVLSLYDRRLPVYLPQRIFITDFDQDGKNEVITVRSRATTSSFFKRFKSFDSGQVECLRWNQVTLKQKWETDEISGYISDLAVGDIDNDGRSEVVFPVITQSGSIIKKNRSHIFAWNNPLIFYYSKRLISHRVNLKNIGE